MNTKLQYLNQCALVVTVCVLTPLIGYAAESLESEFPNATWSVATKGIRCGIDVLTSDGKIIYPRDGGPFGFAEFRLLNETTNTITLYPPGGLAQMVNLTVSNTSGVLVKKTAKGKTFGAPLQNSRGISGAKIRNMHLMPLNVPPGGSISWGFLEICDCFEFEHDGDYKLVVVLQMYNYHPDFTPGPNKNTFVDRSVATPIVFPPVALDIQVRNVEKGSR